MAAQGHRPSEVFAARLRETRRARGLSQTELAQRMTEAGRPMSKAALLRIENGTRGLALDEALALTALLFAVPAHLLTPPGDEVVWLTDKYGVDGAGMRAWLRYGDAFIAQSGDLPDELVADREQEAMAALGVHAQAMVDAARSNDKAGKTEAYRAIISTVLDRERRRESDWRPEWAQGEEWEERKRRNREAIEESMRARGATERLEELRRRAETEEREEDG